MLSVILTEYLNCLGTHELQHESAEEVVMTNAIKTKIKLNPVDGEVGKFSRATWHKFGPFNAEINKGDGSLTITVPGVEGAQILTPKPAPHGDYWLVNMEGGPAFARFRETGEYGSYLLLSLTTDAESGLPVDVISSINKMRKDKSTHIIPAIVGDLTLSETVEIPNAKDLPWG